MGLIEFFIWLYLTASSHKNVYLIGDSMAAGLSQPIAKEVRKAGNTFHSRYKIGSTVIDWAKMPELDQDIRNYNPDTILISLGTNDMKVINFNLEKRSLKSFLKKIQNSGAKEIIWIVPTSMPFKDNGFLKILEDVDVKKVMCGSYERSHDKIHFTMNGYKDWANCIALHLRD